MCRLLFLSLTIGLSMSLRQPAIAGLGAASNKVQTKFETWCSKKYNKCTVDFSQNALKVVGKGTGTDGIRPSQMLSFSSTTNTKQKKRRRNYTFVINYQEDGNNLTGKFIFSDPKVANNFRKALVNFCPKCVRYGNWVGL